MIIAFNYYVTIVSRFLYMILNSIIIYSKCFHNNNKNKIKHEFQFTITVQNTIQEESNH